MALKKTSSSKFRSKKVIGALIIVVIILVIAVLELTNTTHIFHSEKASSGKIPTTSSSKKTGSSKTSSAKTASTDSPVTATTADTSSKNTGGGATAPTASGAAPQAPFGGFVSNHTASLDSGGEQSSCITSPGATCAITFTNDSGVVKTLQAQTTDGNGNTSWDWDLNTAGFTAGNWKITATATLNGQTRSTTDPKPLKVGS